MSLISRLTGSNPAEVKLPVHTFMAALAELKRGAPGVTLTAIGDAFGLDAGERTDLASFATNQYGEYVTREMTHDVLLMAEDGLYTDQNVSDRLLTPQAASQNLFPRLVQSQIQILARGVNEYVLQGCAVSAQGSPNMTLAVTKGAVFTNGILRPVTAGNVTISAADANSPRIDIVVVDSSGTKQVRAGTPGTTLIPATLNANDVALCFVYIAPTDTAIQNGELSDARVMMTSGPALIGKITSPVVFNTTNAAQDYINLSVPSGLFAAGKVLRVRCGGSMLLNSGTPTVTLRIAYGGTTLFQDVTASATADTDRLAWFLDFDLVAQAINSQKVVGAFQFGIVGAKTAPNTGFGDIGANGNSCAFRGTASVDSDAADRALQVQFTMSVSNVNNEIVMEYATGELV